MLTDEMCQKLVQAALDVRQRAYAPYSHYAVGAALLTRSGQIFTGVNVENSVYPLGICAERTAVFSAITAGEMDFIAIAVATSNGGTPCGACRQVLAEFGEAIEVLLADGEGRLVRQTTVAELLPAAFGRKDLPA
jgi:cytidine deaminase